MNSFLLKNIFIVNEGKTFYSDLLIKNGIIEKIGQNISATGIPEIDGKEQHLLPGVIDDQVHFREPGLTHKGDIYSESRAAAAGGITSYMEMPNTIPNVFTQKLLEDKYNIARNNSWVNYSFFMGASNDNIEEVLRTDPLNVCGIKVFMGSSTGNMLVDNEKTLENIFSKSPMLVATHCEDEATIRHNIEVYRQKYGEDIPTQYHPLIRSEEACYKSSSLAVSLAKKYDTRLHILHISTAKEVELFSNDIPLEKKRITAEACVHHLWFSDEDYERLGTKIKWNPAIKKKSDATAILQSLLNNKIDIIATDHAPHTIEEKNQSYFKAPSGGPLVQHALVLMLEMMHQKKISLEKIVEKMSHHPAICFQLKNRGFIREGYAADLVLVNLSEPWQVSKENIYYKCGWSPLEGTTFRSSVISTFINGFEVFNKGKFTEPGKGERLVFAR